MYKRNILSKILERVKEKRRFIQVLAGPRQTGKTTLARQLLEDCGMASIYASADEPALKNTAWIGQHWENARIASAKAGDCPVLLVLDEIQKITGWAETVKKYWDEDTFRNLNVRLMILGSSPLGVRAGLTENLAGRFEVLNVRHWSYPEMKDAFGWDIRQYVLFGGYPGSAELVNDYQRWKNYIRESLVETGISRDILLLARVDKPALLRRLFELGCLYSGQILSYQKMLGQLQDAGNTVTLAHYLDLLSKAGFIAGIQKFAGHHLRKKSSSPKLMVMNNALMTSQSELSPEEISETPEKWGRWVESAIGGYLLNGVIGTGMELYYWNAGIREVDFVLVEGDRNVLVEVKSGTKKEKLSGIEEFEKHFEASGRLLVGTGGISLEDFLSEQPSFWFVRK